MRYNKGKANNKKMKQKRCVCVMSYILFCYGLDPPSIYEWPTKKEGTVVLDPSI